MSEQQNKPQGIPGSSLSGASVESPSAAAEGVGRQSGQQREHGHMSREDQLRDHDQGGSSGTDRVSGHPDTSPDSVQHGVNGGTGQDGQPA